VTNKHPKVGDVVQVALPNGEYAYGRVLRDAAVAFYRARSKEPNQPPTGSREFQFVVRIYDSVLGKWPVVGSDPSRSSEEDWPPPASVTDPITKRLKYIYDRGEMRPLKPDEETAGLEPAEVWEYEEVVDRLIRQAKTH
jgi:hypothetical protein